ncbi:MAG: hypothetical protein KAS04_04825 [Candidatus Aenigmarchaeota archaeon]|nr:hypothetical protein [Candidatus Aenigmarchaeota archaeon]
MATEWEARVDQLSVDVIGEFDRVYLKVGDDYKIIAGNSPEEVEQILMENCDKLYVDDPPGWFAGKNKIIKRHQVYVCKKIEL